MTGRYPQFVLHLEVRCRDISGAGLIDYLGQAVPYYETLPGVSIRLLRDLEHPGRFIEVVEYDSEDAYRSDAVRVESDAGMRRLIAGWRDLLAAPPEVMRYADVTASIVRGNNDG